MNALNEKFMSDEETDSEDSNMLVRRTVTWRSEKLNLLIKKLDERYLQLRQKQENSKPMKGRKTGTPSDRLAPASVHDYHWAITDATIASTQSGDPVPPNPHDQDTSTNSSPDLSLSDSEEEEDQEMASWIANVTGFHA